MTVGTLDRRTGTALGLGVAAILLIRFGVYGGGSTQVVAAGDTVPAAEARLERLRKTASLVPAREAEWKRAQEALAGREKGLIVTETAAQAYAQLLETIRRVAQKEGIDARGGEEMKVAALGSDYGEVSATVTFQCAIEQFVNFMAALANEPVLVATREVRMAAANAKQKTIQVRLSVSAVVPRKLVPEKKGVARF